MKGWQIGLIGCVGLLFIGGLIALLGGVALFSLNHRDQRRADTSVAATTANSATSTRDTASNADAPSAAQPEGPLPAPADTDSAQPTDSEIAAAESEVASFHDDLNAQDYEDIWNGYSDLARARIPHDRTISILTQVHNATGNVTAAERQSVVRTTDNGVPSIRANYQTHFERMTARESFLFRRSGGTLQLSDYSIDQ